MALEVDKERLESRILPNRPVRARMMPKVAALVVARDEEQFIERHVRFHLEMGFSTVAVCELRSRSGSTSKAEVLLWHDCAFAAIPRQAAAAKSTQATTAGSTLVAYRTDVEATGREQHAVANRDLAREGYALSPLDHLLEVLRQHERVVTNRLHIGIAAALLSREVVLYPNSYYKNKAVYQVLPRRLGQRHVSIRVDGGCRDRCFDARIYGAAQMRRPSASICLCHGSTHGAYSRSVVLWVRAPGP